MPEELIQLLRESHTVPVATAGPDGKPNIAGKSVMVMDPGTIVWGELYFGQTYENLKGNPRASLCVWTRTSPVPLLNPVPPQFRPSIGA
jgi:predicted pyridoxine 5'-phosphate oxidase superfamily flavin-nucleotide-binding protein